MATFQTTAVSITFIVLIVTIIMVAIILSSTASSSTYPPAVDVCPDYWSTLNTVEPDQTTACITSMYGCCSDNITAKTLEGTNCPQMCFNTKLLGTPTETESVPLKMNFNDPDFIGSNEKCSKQTWAQKFGLTWDGITNASVCT